MTKEEFKQFRGAIGKLNWQQESKRPDLSYNKLSISMKNKSAMISDLKKMNKIIRKTKKEAEESRIHYKRINNFKNQMIHGYDDASFMTQDNKVSSVEGRMLFLTNGDKASKILWKSKKIARVSDSSKTIETLAMDKTCDEAIHMARMIREIYTGKRSMKGNSSLPF